MISERELDAMLDRWVAEYGPGGFPHENTTNLIQTLIDHKGFVPSGGGHRAVPFGTVADDVEAAVRAMENTPDQPGTPCLCFRAAKVLRMNYLAPDHLPEQERLYRLSRIGMRMSRHTYYRALQLGRAFLLGYLMPAREKAVA